LEYLEENQIKVLPYRTAMEIILWMYPNVLVGGYQSTLYIAAFKGNTAFFFGDITTAILVQLKDLGYFDNANYYN